MIKLKKAGQGRRYNWRPDFRVADQLPEVSAVRTKVFVPGIAASVAIVFVLFILFQEYRAMRIGEDIAKLREEIASYDERHDEKVDLNAEFLALTRTVDEVLEFKQGVLTGSDYLLTVSSNLLDGMYLDRVEYLDHKADIEGSVEVPAEEASRLVDDYLRALEEADALQGLLTQYKLTSLGRDQAGERIKFRIEVTELEEKAKK